jgi:hypothetical protein
MTSDTTVVIEEAEALDSAYDAGYSEFDEIPAAESDEPADLSFFTETARYANVVAPRLRATAGLADSGHGTYQKDREVAVVPVGCEDDEPAQCRLMSARQFYEQAVHPEWRRGAHDALEGHPRGHSVDRESEIATYE